MNKFLVFAVLAIAAFATAAWGDNDGARSFTLAPEISRSPQQVDGGGIAFQVKNIQVEAKWSVDDGGVGLTIDENSGVLTWPSNLNAQTVVVNVRVEDNFKKLNSAYVNLAASAIITINFVNPRMYVIAGFGSDGDVWSSANGKDWTKCGTGTNARNSFATAVFKGKIYFFRGRNNINSTRFNTVYSNNDCDTGWEQVKANNNDYWIKREGHAVAVLNNTLFLSGGYSGSTNWRNDVWSSTDGAIWTISSTNLGGARYHHRMVSWKGKLWISGGTRSASSSLKDVKSSADGKTWSNVAKTGDWGERHGHGFVVHKDKLYVIGGARRTSGNDAFLSDVWSSGDGTNWTIGTGTIGPTRGYFRAVSMNGKIYIMGGLNGSHFTNNRNNSVWSSTDGLTWTAEGNADWGTRYNHGAVVFN